MASKVRFKVETKLVCDRCRAKATIRSNVNPKDRENWLSLHADIISKESWDLCPQCAQDFRERFMKDKEIEPGEAERFMKDRETRILKGRSP